MNRSHTMALICSVLWTSMLMTLLEWLMLTLSGVHVYNPSLLPLLALGLAVAFGYAVYLWHEHTMAEIEGKQLLASGEIVTHLPDVGLVFVPSTAKRMKPYFLRCFIVMPALWTFLIMIGVLPAMTLSPLTIGFIMVVVYTLVKGGIQDFFHGYLLHRITEGTLLPSGEELVAFGNGKPRILRYSAGRKVMESFPDTPELRAELMQEKHNQLGVMPEIFLRMRRNPLFRKKG